MISPISSNRVFRPVFLLFLLLSGTVGAGAQQPDAADTYLEAPRVTAALAQGRAAEIGSGIRKNLSLAVALYCDAGAMGSPEGFFRVGRLLAGEAASVDQRRVANAYLALAARLGSVEALKYHVAGVGNGELGDDCAGTAGGALAKRQMAGGVWETSSFDLDAYLARQPLAKQRIAVLIRNVAPQYKVDPRLALAIALAESNLNADAVSPKNAQGVMQLIPATQERFGVRQPFDPEHNVRGALAYLNWLQKRFAGDWRLVVAAYNSGEGAVDRYGGIPPYPETQQYVRRVLHLTGAPAKVKI